METRLCRIQKYQSSFSSSIAKCDSVTCRQCVFVWERGSGVVCPPLQIELAHWKTARRRLAGAMKCLALRITHRVSNLLPSEIREDELINRGFHRKLRSTLSLKNPATQVELDLKPPARIESVSWIIFQLIVTIAPGQQQRHLCPQ